MLLLCLWPGTGGFCVSRSFTLTLPSSLLAEAAGSHVSELVLRRIWVFCQGGHSWGPLTARLLFQGRRFQCWGLCLCALPLGALGPCWLRDDCPNRLLLVAQGQHQRKTPKDCTYREIGPKFYFLALFW